MHLRSLWWLPLWATVMAFLPSAPAAHAAEPAASGGSADGRVWLERMRAAARERSYQGTMVFTAGEAVSSSRVARFCIGDQVLERVETLDGRQQRVYRHNDVVHTFWPGRKVVTLERQDGGAESPAMPEFDLRLTQHYDVQAMGAERLAGRDAQVLMLKPRDEWRFAQRLWADQATGVMLRADVLSAQGAVLESSAFSDIDLAARPQRDAVINAMKKLDGYRVVTVAPVPVRLDAEGWTLARVPAGFKLVSCVRRGIGDPVESGPASAPEAVQAVFTDGLARVSVFIETVNAAQQRKPMMTQTGATYTLMKPVGERWWVTVMGDVPPATLRQFFAALERRP